MGYYTRHELEVVGGSDELIAELIYGCEEAGYALEENGDCRDESKWYKHQTHMKLFSLKHPDVLFILTGEGEESGDIWKEYYKGGKVQVCQAKVVFADFHPSLLV